MKVALGILCVAIVFCGDSSLAAQTGSPYTSTPDGIIATFVSAGPVTSVLSGISPHLRFRADGKPTSRARFWKALDGCYLASTGMGSRGEGHLSEDWTFASFYCYDAGANRTSLTAVFQFVNDKMVVAEVTRDHIPTVSVPVKW